MMKTVIMYRYKILSSALYGLVMTLVASCNFLEVIPNDTPTLDHAFANRSMMEKFLRTCYSHLPDPTDPMSYPAYFTTTDELIMSDSRAMNSPAGMIAKGQQNTNNPYHNYWSGVNGGKALYTAIRDCNIFLENAHMPKDIEEGERARWIAEVKVLKAYYHFFLMKLYGPIVLVKENLPLSASPEEVRVFREPVDECVDYIVELLDEAIADLPPVLLDPPTEQGRFDQTIAKSIKAKVLAHAASPLFNGNTDYAGWVDKRGKQMINPNYDPTKWEKAATAIREAIDHAHANGYRLYEFNKFAGGAATFAMNDTLVRLMTHRKAITESLERNPGVIWATQEQFADGKGNAAALGYSVLGNMLRMLYPLMYAQDQSLALSYYYASWQMVELYYSNNGVPIEEDKFYDYGNRFRIRRATPGDKHESYIATGEITANIHFNREPRFYASLGFDRGYFELASTTTDGGKKFGVFLRRRAGEIGSSTPTMYAPKKIIAFESSASQGQEGKAYSPHLYQFPLLRLADLYLLYAEALNEVKGSPDQEVYDWIDRVRAVAGLDGVVASWQNASVNPEAPRNKNDMRRIIHKERLIELAFEGQRFWDLRRWKEADQYWTRPLTTWTNSRDPEEYYVPVTSGTPRQFSFRDYLYPLRAYDLRVNTNLEQTYGWD